jgi:hypothetical protein
MEDVLMDARTERNTTSGWPALRQWLSLGPLLLIFFTAGACASPTLNVVQDGALVRALAIPGVSVIRQGTRLQASSNMSLQARDQIQTDAASTAVLGYDGGARVYVQPNAHVDVESGKESIFVFLGAVLTKVKGAFEVKTKYATGGAKGTEYLVRVDPGAHVRIVVGEGQIGLSSNSGRWQTILLTVGQASWIVGAGLPEIGQASPEELEGLRSRIKNLDSLMPDSSGLGTAAIMTGIFAIGVGILNSSRPRGDDDIDRQPPASSPPAKTTPQTTPKAESRTTTQVQSQAPRANPEDPATTRRRDAQVGSQPSVAKPDDRATWKKNTLVLPQGSVAKPEPPVVK